MPSALMNPIGYLIASTIQSAGSFVICHATACHIGLFIGSSNTLVSFAMDIKQDQRSFQIDKKCGALKVKRKLSEFVELHSGAKQLSEKKFDRKIYDTINKSNYSFLQQTCSWLRGNLWIFHLESVFVESFNNLQYTSIVSIGISWVDSIFVLLILLFDAYFVLFPFSNGQRILWFYLLNFVLCFGHSLWFSSSVTLVKVSIANLMNWTMSFIRVIGILISWIFKE